MKPFSITTLVAVLVTSLAGPAFAETIRHTLRCESRDFSSRQCTLPIPPRRSQIKDIRLLRQLSSKPCIEGHSWFANESEIVVKNGCRGEFQVVYDLRGGYDRHEARPWDAPSYHGDPTEIVVRSFEDVLNRPPSREELRYYRSMIIDRGWSERDIRSDLREDRHKGRR
jgi:Protein of unknown function (DUF3011)